MTAVSNWSCLTCADGPSSNLFLEGMPKRSVSPAHCSYPGLQCAGTKSGYGYEKCVVQGEGGEFKVATKSDAENAIITAER